MRRAIVLLTALALLAACSQSGEISPPSGEAASPAASLATAGHGLLPAFALPGERDRVGAKADEASDYREAHPEWYAITVPPAVEGFRHMVEWEPMAFNAIAYSDYLDQDPDVRQTMIDIAVNTLDYADLHVIYNSAGMRTDFIDRLRTAGITSAYIDEHVTFHNITNDSIWFIDYGPLPLVDDTAGAVAFADFRYYNDRYYDDGIATQFGHDLGISTYRMPFDIEGGNFQGDGQGTCFTTERAFEYGGTQAELEAVWGAYAACDEVVVLRDIHNDATGHIDMFFKIVSPTEAFIGEFTAAQDATAKADMDWNADLLEARGMTVHRMPMPNAYQDPVYGPIPRTYLNSTMINGARGKVNLWPVYTADQDIQAAALAVWESVLPEWTHVGINSDVISSYSGAMHCVTRTVPDQAFTPWVADGTCTDNVCVPPAGGYAGECIDSDDCWGPAWVCPTNDCVPCETVADCDDGNPCTIDGCDVGCFWTPMECEDGYVCLGGECVEAGAKTCESPFVLSCGATLSDDSATGAASLEAYSCISWTETGPEHVFQLTLDENRPVDLLLSGLTADLDLFILEGACDGNGCVGGSAGETDTESVEGFMAMAGTTYYIVIDGYEGATSSYTLSVTCGEACEPDCSAVQCGPDPVCGIDCGGCDDGQTCNDGMCIADPCTDMPYEGCCDESLVHWCDDEGFQTIDCSSNEAPADVCGYSTEAGFFDCGGADDVPDGLDLNCPWAVPCADDGDCDDEQACTEDVCVAGRCEWNLIPGCCEDAGDCNDRNPCTTDACTDNECVHEDIADCECTAALCDDDNVCTTDSCSGDGLCLNMPVAGCCLDAGDCGDGDACTEDACVDNACVNENNPDCTECTSDAQCDDGNICTIDYCQASDTTCQHGPIQNCCNVDADCDDGNACHIGTCGDQNDCAYTDVVCDAGEVCNPDSGCEPECVPDCANKECGPNGCGGFCGDCEDGWECNERGVCFQACDCTGMQCGAPSAGCPECGTCAADELCNEMFQCVPDPDYVPDAGGTAGDVVGGTDTGSAGNDGGGGSCSAGSGSGSGLAFLLMVFGLAVVLRRRALARG